MLFQIALVHSCLWLNSIPFYVCTASSSSVCLWMDIQLFPCLGYHEWCHCEHSGVCACPWRLTGRESACQCRRCGFNLWITKIPRNRKWQPTLLSILAWEIACTEETGGLQSVVSQRVRLNLATKQQLVHSTCTLPSRLSPDTQQIFKESVNWKEAG